MNNPYDQRYDRNEYYWGVKPSDLCYRVLQTMPLERPLTLLDIGCGEGRNAVFFARNGYHVTAFDTSPIGLEKAKRLAVKANVRVEVFEADVLDFRLTAHFDVIFSTGVLHYIPHHLREDIFANYRAFTKPGGLNVFSVFVKKPFVPAPPDEEITAHQWISGELMTFYRDWRIEYCTEEIFACSSSGVPHHHAVNRILARKETG